MTNSSQPADPGDLDRPARNGARPVDSSGAKSPEAADKVTAAHDETQLDSNRSAASITSSLPAGEWVQNVPRNFGRYLIERELGRGGMGAVFLAMDQQLQRRVALKIPLFHKDEYAESLERFYREARAMATLQHSNLCPIYDVGSFESWHFMTMAFIDGEPLSHKLRKHGDLSLSQGIGILQTAAVALEKAHGAGIIHRDLKPSNIMLTRDLEPIIMDFGLARMASSSDAELTQSGAVLGSPAYMAPEQVEARHDEIGEHTDVYALGVILYQLVTGRRPFEGSVASIFGQIVSREPDPPSSLVQNLPPLFDEICLRAIAKVPAQRQQTAAALANDLLRLLADCESLSETLIYTPAARPNEAASQSPERSSSPSGTTSSSRRDAELRQVTIAHFNFESDDSLLSGASGSHSEILQRQSLSFEQFVKRHLEAMGGTVVASSGQEVIACFGFPQAFEDASQRAVRSALAFLRELSNELRTDPQLPAATQTWVTVHSGEAIAELSDTDNGVAVMLVGEARNTAARLNAFAELGTVLLSSATQKRVELYFECESLGVQRIRGLSQPLELFRVTGEAASRNRVDLVDPGNLTPLIGRDTELAILKDRWEQASEELGQIVLLIGDAGLGKSRLIREIREHIIGSTEECEPAVVEFRCSQYHGGAAFFPAIEYLARLLEFGTHSDSANRLQAIERYLRELGLLNETNVSLLAGLLSVPCRDRYPDLNVAPQRQKELTHELLQEWLRALTRKTPVVFIVEDLHWIDPTTMEFITTHVEDFEIGRLLTILTFRPEFQTPWGSLPHQTQIALNRLTRRQIAEVMRRITARREIPESMLLQIVERTDGVPLFIEEFTHVIMESGMLDSDADASSAFHLTIPATLQELLLSRLDRMESNRDVVQLAAAIGREFSYELLAASSDLPVDELQRELDKLVRAEVLFQKGRLPEAQYIFKHALIQDSAYNALLRQKRNRFHRRIAESLEGQFPEVASNQPELLAQHFTEAECDDKAIAYWLRAGERSRERSAHDEAIQHLTRGLELISAQPASETRDSVELQFQLPLSASYIAVRGYAAAEVEEHVLRARELCERLGPTSPLFHVMMILWALRFIRSESDSAVGTSLEILELAGTRDASFQAEAHWARTASEWWAGDFERALDLGKRGVELYDIEASLPHARALQQNSGPLMTCYIAWSYWVMGFSEQASSWLDRALELAERLDDKFSLVVTRWQYSFLTGMAGLTDQTLQLTDQVIAESREQSYAFWEALGMGTRASAVRQQGDADRATELLTEALSRCDAIGSGILHTVFLGELADALWESGKRDAAWEALNRAIAHDEEHRQRAFESELKRRRGKFLFHDSPSDPAAAEACLLDAIATAKRQKARMFELRSSLELARQWAGAGRTHEARSLVEPLCRSFTEGRDAPDLRAAEEFLANLN